MNPRPQATQATEAPGQASMSAMDAARRLFLGFLQTSFGSRPSGSYRWVPEQDHSQIYITSEYPVRPDVFTKRPALVVARGPISFWHLGIGEIDEFDPRTGTRTKTTVYQGVLTLIAMSRVMVEAERLALLCTSEVMARRNELLGTGKFFDFGQAIGVSAPSAPGSMIEGDRGDGIIAVSASFPFALVWSARITPVNRQLVEGVDLTLQVSAPSPVKAVFPEAPSPQTPQQALASAMHYPAPRLPQPTSPVAPLFSTLSVKV